MGAKPLSTARMQQKVKEANSIERLQAVCLDLLDAINELHRANEAPPNGSEKKGITHQPR